MMISRQEIYHVLRSHSHAAQKLEADKTGAASTREQSRTLSDGVQLSDRAKDIQRLSEIINKLPEVRQERVSSIAEAINTGDYKINEEAVAEKIIGRSLVDHFI